MMKIENALRCIVVDDEEPAHDVLKHYAMQTPYVEIVGQAYNAIEALDLLRKMEVDVLFLDIEMPGISGIELLSALKNKPKVIITSAYSEYAIKGFDLNVADYLLKPFSIQRFLQAIEKSGVTNKANLTFSGEEDTWMKIGESWMRITMEDIEYIQSYGNYAKVFLSSKKPLLVNATTTYLQDSLPSPPFLRVHKSYLVNMNKVTSLSLITMRIAGIEIPIGRTYKGYVKAVFSEWKKK